MASSEHGAHRAPQHDPQHESQDGTQHDGLEGQQRGEPTAEHGGHGTSVAAWVACLGVIAGATVVAFGIIFASVTVSVIGAVLIVVMALMGPVLSRAGFGEKSTNREASGGPRAVR